MLASFMKITIWVFAVALPLSWLGSNITTASQTWSFDWPAIIGGTLFGVGATMNGGCAFYTLTRLTSGNLALLFTLVGFLLGYAFQLSFFTEFSNEPASPTVVIYEQPSSAALSILAIVWLFFLWEIRRLWQSCKHIGWTDRLLANRYRLSTAAVMLGFSNGLLFVFWGPWAYTSALRQQVAEYQGTGTVPDEIRLGLFIAVLTGMLLSSWQRGEGFLTWGERRLRLPHLAGGTLMGIGAAMAPGGNDALLLYGIPMFSPHALPAFLAMLSAIAITLLLGKSIIGLSFRTNCRGDQFHPVLGDK